MQAAIQGAPAAALRPGSKSILRAILTIPMRANVCPIWNAALAVSNGALVRNAVDDEILELHGPWFWHPNDGRFVCWRELAVEKTPLVVLGLAWPHYYGDSHGRQTIPR